MARGESRRGVVVRRERFSEQQHRRVERTEARRAERGAQLYDEVCVVGRSILGDKEGVDEWPCLVEEWLLANVLDVLDRELTYDDVLAGMKAWEFVP